MDSRKKFIETNGYTYSFFGRKRRLTNVFSADKGIAAHEVRSGINAEVQSIASDVNLLAAMDTADAVAKLGLDAKIFMLVHDSIVAIVKDEHVDEYCKVSKHYTQLDRGCSIMGNPIGIDQDVGQDYSFGKFDDRYALDGTMLVKVVSTTAEHIEVIPELPTHNIWMEGYLTNGMDNTPSRAICLGSIKAKTFEEACNIMCSPRSWQNANGNYNKENKTVWGCRLFDNEAEARRSFG